MKKNGSTSAGRTRWRCKDSACGASATRSYDRAAADLRAGLDWLFSKDSQVYFVKLICTVSSLFLDSFVVHSGRFGLSGFLLVLFGYFISEWVFL